MSKYRHQLLITPLALALGLLLLAGQVEAHGVRGMTGTIETICATVTYDDGEPMSYGGVEISAPDSELPFQSGRTDRNGLFCFKPDSPGEWQLIINDGMGHQVSLQTMVGQDMALAQINPSPEHNDMPMGKTGGILSGIAVIFGLSGCLTWWLNRKKTDKIKYSQKE